MVTASLELRVREGLCRSGHHKEPWKTGQGDIVLRVRKTGQGNILLRVWKTGQQDIVLRVGQRRSKA